MGRRRRRGGRPTSIAVGIVCLPGSVPPLRSIRGCRRRRRRLNDGGKSIGHEPGGRAEGRPSASGPRFVVRFFDAVHDLIGCFDLKFGGGDVCGVDDCPGGCEEGIRDVGGVGWTDQLL